MTGPALVWLRDDLRVADNPALHAAIRRGGDIVVAFLLDDESPGFRHLGGASRWWLHHSLDALHADLEARGSRLTLRRGAAAVEIPALVDEIRAEAVYWNRRYGKAEREVDTALKARLHDDGLDVESFQANLLFEPWTIRTGSGTPFKVFTPFYRACLEQPDPRHPYPAPHEIPSPHRAPEGVDLDALELLPRRPDWAGGLRDRWQPGEKSAHRTLNHFVTTDLVDYSERDFPARDTTSHLSAHLRFGEISPFQLWHRLHEGLPAHARDASAAFLRQVVWREFNHSILFEQPELATKNYRPEFDAFPWSDPDPELLAAWQQGRTGIPLVDAGMRELTATGVMHNRVRLVAASFLVKNLLIDWRIGEQWFWDRLVDADAANNPGNWQWVAGSGADAAPYFRVFNPLLQADKFDPDRAYIRQWVPELDSGDYPEPIVDLKASRQQALAAYERMRRASGTT